MLLDAPGNVNDSLELQQPPLEACLRVGRAMLEVRLVLEELGRGRLVHLGVGMGLGWQAELVRAIWAEEVLLLPSKCIGCVVFFRLAANLRFSLLVVAPANLEIAL